MASQELQQVYLLWHTRELEDGEVDEKLLGVYSTEEKATRRIASARTSFWLQGSSRWFRGGSIRG